jgi:hypothetical protein
VTIAKKQQLYAYVPATPTPNDYSTSSAGTLRVYHTNDAVLATLKEDGDAVFLSTSKNDSAKVRPVGTVFFPSSSTFQAIPLAKGTSVAPKFYFSAAEADFSKLSNTHTGVDSTHFRYRQWRVYVQAMAIPLKFRRPVEASLAQGATPARAAVHAQVETGPSIALAPGFKHSWHRYRGTKNALGFTTSSFSLSAGALLGLGVVDINAKSTQGRIPDTDASRNAIIPVGAHFVVGFNNLNAGVAGGWDIITGPNRSAWNYHGKFWTGVIVGIDIIK